MKGSQKNHGEYRLPADMQPWANEPLYLIIARWCLQQNRWINRNDVAAAFYLTERRASLQLAYINQKKIELLAEPVSMFPTIKDTTTMRYGSITYCLPHRKLRQIIVISSTERTVKEQSPNQARRQWNDRSRMPVGNHTQTSTGGAG